MTSPVRALGRGVVDVLRAPLPLIGAAVVMLIVTAPFAAVLQSRLQESLSVQPQVSLDDAIARALAWFRANGYATP